MRPMTSQEMKYEDELTRRRGLLLQLKKHEGWELFQGVLAGMERAAFMKTQTEPCSEMAKHFGAYFMAKSLHGWVDNELEAISKAMTDLHHALSS